MKLRGWKGWLIALAYFSALGAPFWFALPVLLMTAVVMAHEEEE